MTTSPDINKRIQKIIGKRLQEWVKLQGWTIVEFARRMKMDRANVYGYFDGDHDPQKLFVRLRAEGCDLNKLTADLDRLINEEKEEAEPEEKQITGATPLLSKKQAQMIGFLEENRVTYEDLRRIYRPDLTIEEFLKLYKSIQKKVRRQAEQQRSKEEQE